MSSAQDTLLWDGVLAKYAKPRGFDSLSVSKIFHWYSEDFEKEAGSVLDWLKRYDAAGRLDRFTSATRLRRLPYDWKLNMLPAR